MVSKKYEVTALVVSYRPEYEKLMMTIRSFILQKNISLQIVVADDGSPEDMFPELKSYFSEIGFEDYALVKNIKNQGTVKNVLSGLIRCEGEYVKILSPGDYMASGATLRNLVDYMVREKITICGSDYFCYRYNRDGKLVPLKEKLTPCISGISGRKLRMNYLLNEDRFLGAATLCENKVLLEYMSMLDNEVKYAEDNCYRIMAYCGEAIGFYGKETVVYEVGTGVSTNNKDGWKPLWYKDWTAANNIMLRMKNNDAKLKKAFELHLNVQNMNYCRKFLQYLRVRGLVLLKLVTKIRSKPRISSDTLPVEWINRLGGNCAET